MPTVQLTVTVNKMTNQELHYRKTLNDIGRKLNDEDMRSIRFICKAVDGLTKRDLEVEEPLEFFVKLEERGVLAYNDTDFLRELLCMVNRRDCLVLLGMYENATPSTDGASVYYREPVQATGQKESSFHSTNHYQPHGSGHVNGHGLDMTDGACVLERAPLAMHKRGAIQQVSESSWGEDLSEAFDIVVEELGRDWRQLARRLHLTEVEIERITEDHARNLREQCMQCLLLWKRKMRTRATKAALIEGLKKCQMLYIADRLQGFQFR